jgi:hypothetical protein
MRKSEGLGTFASHREIFSCQEFLQIVKPLPARVDSWEKTGPKISPPPGLVCRFLISPNLGRSRGKGMGSAPWALLRTEALHRKNNFCRGLFAGPGKNVINLGEVEVNLTREAYGVV